MAEISFPEELKKYLVAYDQIGNNEWVFFLKDFPVKKIRIKSVSLTETRSPMYKGIADVEFCNAGNKHLSSPSVLSSDPLECVIDTLAKIIQTNGISGSTTNREFYKY